MPMSQLLFSFNGRLNRKPYWLTTLAIVAVSIVALLLIFVIAGGVGAFTDEGAGLGVGILLLGVLYIPLLWVGLALGVKRLHDRNKSGWWLLLFWFLPAILQGIGEYVEGIGIVLALIGLAISLWGLVEIGFLRGTVGPNQYGPDPLEAKL
jgi:uncharacterized membrane protein YhaH (DUF805 family)